MLNRLRPNYGSISEGIGIEADIRVSVKNTEVKDREAMSGPATRLQLEWEAARMPRLFPLMKADLSIYPITATETQLDFNGLYEPPLGPLGKAVNAMVGHRIAEVSVHRFVSDVAGGIPPENPSLGERPAIGSIRREFGLTVGK